MVIYKYQPEGSESGTAEHGPRPSIIVTFITQLKAVALQLQPHTYKLSFMGKSTRPPAEVPVPDSTPELSPDIPESPIVNPPSQPRTDPEHTPSPEITPDTDPDLPQKPGPPLTDPETPRG